MHACVVCVLCVCGGVHACGVCGGVAHRVCVGVWGVLHTVWYVCVCVGLCAHAVCVCVVCVCVGVCSRCACV